MGDKEFSTKLILDSNVDFIGGDLSQVKSLRGAETTATLMATADLISKIHKFMK